MNDKLSKEFIQSAINDTTWDVMNGTLYDLCKRHPRHNEPEVIIAKICMIGRTYSAAIERRRRKNVPLLPGGRFYRECVAPKILNSEIDKFLDRLRCSSQPNVDAVLDAHAGLVKIFKDISEENKPSLASKYLHFHSPENVFIYDSIAVKKLRILSKYYGWPSLKSTHTYSEFFQCCQFLKNHIEERHKIFSPLSPRNLDKILLANFEQA